MTSCLIQFEGNNPKALFTVSPSHGLTDSVFIFDASDSHDEEDELADLNFYWDWQSDGIWDLKSNGKTPIVTHKFDSGSFYTATLKVTDTEDKSDKAGIEIHVYEEGNVTDVDGNVYKTIKIGKQWWMAENLRVIHYRNGSAIQHVTNQATWQQLPDNNRGAYCDYGFVTDRPAIFGHLYNWYAVDDSQQIAPEGWHVPTSDEWEILFNILGGSDVAGGKMKATSYWGSPNTDATNESYFSALPAGRYDSQNSFCCDFYNAFFWASTKSTTWPYTYAYCWELHWDSGDVIRGNYFRNFGLSIRCVRDE